MTTFRAHRIALAAISLVVLGLAACGGDTTTADPTTAGPTTADPTTADTTNDTTNDKPNDTTAGSVPAGMEVTPEMVDQIVSVIEANGVQVDRECVDEAIQGLDLSTLAGIDTQSPDPELLQAFMSCMVMNP